MMGRIIVKTVPYQVDLWQKHSTLARHNEEEKWVKKSTQTENEDDQRKMTTEKGRKIKYLMEEKNLEAKMRVREQKAFALLQIFGSFRGMKGCTYSDRQILFSNT